MDIPRWDQLCFGNRHQRAHAPIDRDNGVPLYTTHLTLSHSPYSPPKVLQDFKLGDKPGTLWLISKNGPTHFSSNPYAFKCYCNVDLYLEYR